MSCEVIIQLLIAAILFFTLIAAISYACVTKKLWQESVKQTRLLMRPIVVITYDENEDKFKYINYGNAPAFKIKIDDVSLINTSDLKFDFIFPEEIVLPQLQQVVVENIKKKINNNISEIDDTFELGALIPFSATRTFEVVIRYVNAENEKFFTEGRLGQGTFELKRIERLS